MMMYQLLEWDSKFFGFPVVRLSNSVMSETNLASVLHELQAKGVTLVYWASDFDDEESQRAAQKNNGFLADEKRTYLTNPDNGFDFVAEVAIQEYEGESANVELESLALQAGAFSRYKIDSRMPAGTYEALYKLWIQRSADRTLAHAILVAQDAGRIVGMATVGEKQGRGDIGLVAVDESMRGRNLGSALIAASLQWFRRHGYNSVQVVTQGINLPGCKLYEKCHFFLEKTEKFYHFWLR